jgi:FAD/FMN-containing dehydrogenase
MWDAKQLEYKPTCRVEPVSTEEVASTLGVIVDNWCTFAVKSGGHSRIRGSSNSVGGVTIDLDRINTIELLDNKKRARIGSGAIWRDVYATLEKEGITVTGGRVSGIGVGGLTLGGGISFLAQKHGWASDNVLEYTVCLASMRKEVFSY